MTFFQNNFPKWLTDVVVVIVAVIVAEVDVVVAEVLLQTPVR